MKWKKERLWNAKVWGKIKFENLLVKLTQFLSKIEEERNKVHELTQEYRGGKCDKNVFADIMAVGAFIWFLVFSKREIAVLKDFIDNVVYGLSDSQGIYYCLLIYL